MSVGIRTVGEVQILELSGDFTLGSSPMARPLDLQGRRLDDLGDTLRDLLGRGHRKILLDLRRVNFIDSAGLGELVACKKRTAERGGDIKLLQPTGRVRELLVMTLLIQLFDVFQDETEAVDSFRGERGDAVAQAPAPVRP